MTAPVIYWHRQDLRLDDLPGLSAASAEGEVIPCYILDDTRSDPWGPGTASRWWLHHSLVALGQQLKERGGKLLVLRGKPEKVLPKLAAETGASAVYCSELFEPAARQVQQNVARSLEEDALVLRTSPGTTLVHPEYMRRPDGSFYKVFTPFWRKLRQGDIAEPTSTASTSFWSGPLTSLPASEWDLLEGSRDYSAALAHPWQPGQHGAQQRMETFVASQIHHYDAHRNAPAKNACSRLSPHLHFGEISPHRIWHTAIAQGPEADGFLSEVVWREFNYHQLYANPDMPEIALRVPFRNFPWLPREDLFNAWKAGMTGYPLVDAGMRELAQTGFMHNRVRMVAASFLCKHLLIPWQWGARWFWDQLVDADLASNSGGWQWVAGCGLDAAPYFRVFNPIIQSEKFDPQGDYVKRWVPELSELQGKSVHKPWLTPLLAPAYPAPIVDHAEARRAALAAWDTIRAQSA